MKRSVPWAKRGSSGWGPSREAEAFLGTLERLERRSREAGEVMNVTSRREEGPLDPALALLTDPETGVANRVHFDVVYRVVFAAGTRGFPMGAPPARA